MAVEITRQIVKENAANSTHLAAMFDVEILITPLLKLVIVIGGMPVADALECCVKVNDIFEYRVVRRQVGASSKPGRIALLEVPEIGVHCWDVRIERMNHKRNPGGIETTAATELDLRRKRFRKLTCY